MKKVVSIVFLIIPFYFIGCDEGGGGPSETLDENLGTFLGEISVADIPQTSFGYILNSGVNVSRNGDNFTIRALGDSGFSREYSGIVSTDEENTIVITVLSQTRPIEQTVMGNVVIQNGELTLSLTVPNDTVEVIDKQEENEIFEISGSLRIIGIDMMLQ
ncbi:hypothetical protein [uncultured Croceitalea sp.]|uniref:hypothetical protein n=1 Tax=uncultured Croceitalea sp. TaxID=1798908 RepID=UPI00374E847B